MPDRTKLRVGDRLRLLAVPEADLEQREREIREGRYDAGWTANTIERILQECPLVTISHIDEYGLAWFELELQDSRDETEYHSIAIMDDDSWEYAEDARSVERKSNE